MKLFNMDLQKKALEAAAKKKEEDKVKKLQTDWVMDEPRLGDSIYSETSSIHPWVQYEQ